MTNGYLRHSTGESQLPTVALSDGGETTSFSRERKGEHWGRDEAARACMPPHNVMKLAPLEESL